VYYAFAEYVISNGGVIAGCVYDDDWYGAHHVIGKNTEDLNKIYGSKYFQSDTANIYRLVKEKLDNNIEVLFCGAPCQVAGLYGYLNGDSDNLTTVDFICRGINSPKAYRAYMLELEKKYKSRIRKVHFKDKTQGWTNLGTKVEFENGRTYFRNRNTDPWVNGFIVGSLYMRPSCSQCEYRRFPRVADITVGDFWGLDFSKEDARKGVSVVLCNSKKGSELLKECKSCFNIKEHDLDTAVNGNPALVKSIPMSEHRKEFFDNVDSESYSSLVWRLVGLTSPKRQIIYMKFIIKQKIRHFIKR
jgi:coenzyme F420-reducing hydrogenase beta subunit